MHRAHPQAARRVTTSCYATGYQYTTAAWETGADEATTTNDSWEPTKKASTGCSTFPVWPKARVSPHVSGLLTKENQRLDRCSRASGGIPLQHMCCDKQETPVGSRIMKRFHQDHHISVHSMHNFSPFAC